MRPDGSITFKTTIDNADVAKELDETKREIERSQKDIAKTEAAKLPMVEEAKKLGVELDRAKEKLYTLQKQQEMAAQALTGTDPGTYADAAAAKPALDAAVADQQKDVDTLQSKWDKVNDKIDQYDQKITQATAALEGQTAKAGELSAQLTKGGIDMSGAIEKAQKSAERFKKRLASIASQAFVFTLISKALKNIVKYLGKVLKSNEQYTSELARLKGALLTAFQPIYEILLPSLLGLLQVATKVATVIARIASILSGKSASQNAKNAQVLYDEANAIEKVGEASKQAKKSLSGFDEINQLGDNTDDREISAWSETSASADFSAFRTDEYKQKIDALAAILSGALLVLGAILAFSGANIPLGIGLMVVGAIGLAAEASANWGAIVEALQGPIGAVVAIGSALLLVIGLILAFTGTAIPLGIGLIAVGAAGLATAAAVNSGTDRRYCGAGEYGFAGDWYYPGMRWSRTAAGNWPDCCWSGWFGNNRSNQLEQNHRFAERSDWRYRSHCQWRSAGSWHYSGVCRYATIGHCADCCRFGGVGNGDCIELERPWRCDR